MSSVTPTRRTIARPIAAGCCAATAALYIAAYDPSSAGTYPACAFRSVTGWSCPGCGFTRATHRLLRGELTEALGHNALVVPVLAMLTLTWLAWLIAPRGARTSWMHRVAVPAWLGLAIVAALFAIVRNVSPFAGVHG